MSPERQEAVAGAHAVLDDVTTKMKAQSAEEGRPMTCRAEGCFSCCKEPACCSEQEAEYMLAGLDDAQLAGVAQRTRLWLAKVMGSGILNEPEQQPFVFYWRALDAWCPMLVDGRCSAYERRPITCRAHMAIEAPELCADEVQRLGQVFMLCSNELVGPVQLAANLEPEPVQFDHIGLHLAALLLKRRNPKPKWTPFRASRDAEDPTLANVYPV